MKGFITHTARATEKGFQLDGETWYRNEGATDFPNMIREAYKVLDRPYRKFYKMDDLAKMGFILSEGLMERSGLPDRYDPDRIGIVLANSASSLDTDRVHQRSVDAPEEEPPSPSVFVYTLPNIAIGEICIRHGITGENAFLIFEGFRPIALHQRVEDLMALGKADACIAGWLEKDGSSFEGFIYTVEREEGAPSGSLPHSAEELQRSFDQSSR